jgi:AmmeMemoRadiSam system protein B
MTVATAIRRPVVAGSFYPADPGALRATVDELLASARPCEAPLAPKALIVPHAGYAFSGPVAATGYRTLLPARETIRRVVLMGPAHRVAVAGLAASSAEAFGTPLGLVPVDSAAVESVRSLPQVELCDEAHAAEHSLEVQLPFLQCVLKDFAIVPFAVGNVLPGEAEEVFDRLWGGPETLIVVSSDLSHFHDSDTARRLDRVTARAIEELDPLSLDAEHACGFAAITGLLLAARRGGLRADLLDLRSSGDIAGPRDRVVGYGAFAFFPGPPNRPR